MITRIILICLLLGCILNACEENRDFIIEQYPFEPGVVRTYERKVSLTGDTVLNHSEIFSLELSGTRVLENGTVLSVMKYTSERDTGYEYYLNNDTALLDYGHQYMASPLPQKKAFASRLTGAFPGLSLNPELPGEIFYSAPLKVYSYPLKEGQSWQVNPKQNDPFMLSKKVIGKSMVITPAGSFQALLIDYEYSGLLSEGVEVKEYLSSAGLLKRVSVMNNLQFTDPEGNPDYNKQITLTEVITLVSVRLE